MFIDDTIAAVATRPSIRASKNRPRAYRSRSISARCKSKETF